VRPWPPSAAAALARAAAGQRAERRAEPAWGRVAGAPAPPPLHAPTAAQRPRSKRAAGRAARSGRGGGGDGATTSTGGGPGRAGRRSNRPNVRGPGCRCGLRCAVRARHGARGPPSRIACHLRSTRTRCRHLVQLILRGPPRALPSAPVPLVERNSHQRRPGPARPGVKMRPSADAAPAHAQAAATRERARGPNRHGRASGPGGAVSARRRTRIPSCLGRLGLIGRIKACEPVTVINLNPGYPSLRSHEPGTQIPALLGRSESGGPSQLPVINLSPGHPSL
jgi:hypothetical protein